MKQVIRLKLGEKRLDNKRFSLFHTFLISYLAMLLIAVAIGAYSYHSYSDAVRKQVELYNRAMLQQTQLVMDQNIGRIETIAMNIESNSSLQSVLNAGAKLDGPDRYSLYQVNRLLINSVTQADFINSIYIYLKKPDLVVTSSAVYGPEDFYNLICRYSDYDFGEWKRLMNGSYFMEYRPEQKVTTVEGEKDVIDVMLSLPLGLNNSNAGTLVISLSSRNMQNLLKEATGINSSAVFFESRNDTRVFSMGDSDLLKDFIKYDPVGDRPSVVGAGGKSVLVSQVTSSVTGWKYISAVPEAEYMYDANRVKDITMLFFLVMLLVGAVLAYLLAKRNVNPIKAIETSLKEKAGIKNEFLNTRNELDFISFITSKTISDNKKLQDDMLKQLPVIRANMLLQVLKGNIQKDEDIRKQLSSVGVDFAEGRFVVVLFSFDEPLENTLRERNLIKFAVGNILEYSLDRYSRYTVDIDPDQLAAIISFPQNAADIAEEIKAACEQTISIVKENLSSVITVSIGGSCAGCENLSDSYRQAAQALEYQKMVARGKVILFEETVFSGDYYSYTTETELRIINGVKTGNYEKVAKTLDEIFEDRFRANPLPLQMLRCLYFDIMSTAFKVISGLGIRFDFLFEEKPNPYETLAECTDVDEMQEALKAIYRTICEYIRGRMKDHGSLLIENIVDYLKTHYQDCEIGLASTADAFRINPNYLSGFFKEQTGKGFMNYVNLLRLSEAKRLLEITGLCLNDVAQKVGYSNSAVLIRNFKKYEGITPGEYRNMHARMPEC